MRRINFSAVSTAVMPRSPCCSSIPLRFGSFRLRIGASSRSSAPQSFSSSAVNAARVPIGQQRLKERGGLFPVIGVVAGGAIGVFFVNLPYIYKKEMTEEVCV